MALVAIIGRPNVGKSSLFNRLIGRREAIVDDTPGVTRDRIYGETEWRGKSFYAVDTGGILGEESAFSAGIEAHVNEAISECDALLMVVDGHVGITAADESVAHLLRRSRKPVVVAVNKMDDLKHEVHVADAYSLGFEHVVGVSALHKRNLEDLLDLLAGLLPDEEEHRDEDEIRLAIVGRPNVGKSSLLNRLAGAERSLVSPLAGTTRDPVDTSVVMDGRHFRLVDTAGLRRRGRMDSALEYYSFVRTLAAVDRSDVALLLMDASAPCTDMDKKAAAHAVEKGKGLILILNKWDLVSSQDRPGDTMTKRIREDLPFLTWAPILFTSALNGRGVGKIAQAAVSVFENRRRRIPTNVLNRLMRDVLAFDRLPSSKRGKSLKIYYCLQSGVEPPAFVFFVNDPGIVDTAFENHVKKELRALEDFTGSPLRVFWRGKEQEG
ncbi:ribosome biogenesis GTPase Der [uncultured Fretibacterium sp.]|uniref:ribosome biogenesis GTPase Der n=1 Tax=uncultured Fretibacterium sp. TaxID=1678694 RepID=UPI002633A594|nr:ribosome biogenesis GTPase Der [uncultured Fretibacterium sp.]